MRSPVPVSCPAVAPGSDRSPNDYGTDDSCPQVAQGPADERSGDAASCLDHVEPVEAHGGVSTSRGDSQTPDSLRAATSSVESPNSPKISSVCSPYVGIHLTSGGVADIVNGRPICLTVPSGS